MRWIIALMILTGILYAQVHQQNVYHLGHIDKALQRIELCAYAYFAGIRIGDYNVPLTQAQKDSLIAVVNRQILVIQVHADSLQQYNP